MKKAFVLLLLLSSALFAEESHSVHFYESIINWYSEHLNYGTVALLMTIESSFIPFPSEVVVPPAAYKALQNSSEMNICLVVLFATIGSLLGAFINYYLAKFLGRPVIYRFANSKFGELCLINAEKLERAENFFRNHGAISTFIGRLITVIRQLISIPAGLSNMKISTFALFTALGAFIWNIVLAVLGVILHGQSDLIEKYNGEISLAIVSLAGLFGLYILSRLFRRKKTSKKDVSK